MPHTTGHRSRNTTESKPQVVVDGSRGKDDKNDEVVFIQFDDFDDDKLSVHEFDADVIMAFLGYKSSSRSGASCHPSSHSHRSHHGSGGRDDPNRFTRHSDIERANADVELRKTMGIGNTRTHSSKRSHSSHRTRSSDGSRSHRRSSADLPPAYGQAGASSSVVIPTLRLGGNNSSNGTYADTYQSLTSRVATSSECTQTRPMPASLKIDKPSITAMPEKRPMTCTQGTSTAALYHDSDSGKSRSGLRRTNSQEYREDLELLNSEGCSSSRTVLPGVKKHLHPLVKSKQLRLCDGCGQITLHVTWRCDKCEYALCQHCMDGVRRKWGLEEIMQCEKEWREEARLNPTDYVPHYNLGVLLHCRFKYFKEAEQEYRLALERNPRGTYAHHFYGLLKEHEFKAYDQAIVCYRNALRCCPDFADAHNALGVALWWRVKQYDESAQEFLSALRYNPDHWKAHHNYALLLDEVFQRYPEAVEEFREAVRCNPNWWKTHYDLGLILHEKVKDFTNAEIEYREALRCNKTNWKVYCNLGYLLHTQLHRYNDSEEAYKNALRLEQDNWLVHRNLGLLYKSMNRLQDAENSLRDAVKHNPDNWKAHVNLAGLCEETHQYDKAQESYREAIRCDPQCWTAQYNLGTLLQQHYNNHAEAEVKYRAAIQSHPSDWKPHFNLALLLHYHNQKLEEAEREYKVALKYHDKDAKTHFHYAVLLQQMQRNDQASCEYAKAIELDQSLTPVAIQQLKRMATATDPFDKARRKDK